jgi:hypothetical protein
MAIASLLKRLTNALPVVLAAAPGVVDAVNQVRKALKKPTAPANPGSSPRGQPAASGAIER